MPSTTSLVLRYAGGMDKKPNIPYAVPKASSDPLPEISNFLEPFAPLFRRSQSRHSLEVPEPGPHEGPDGHFSAPNTGQTRARRPTQTPFQTVSLRLTLAIRERKG